METTQLKEELAALKLIYPESELTISFEDNQTTVKYRSLKNIFITFQIDGFYPSKPPAIKLNGLDDTSKSNHLQLILFSKAAEIIGEPMLYSLIDIAKSNIEENNLSLSQSSSMQQKICPFYAEGKCKFGERCFNRHIDNSSGVSLIVSGSKQGVTLVKSNSKEDSPVGTTKKKPMRTATDVIKRIKWDENLSISEFIVGYLDRFVGIVEKNFTEFSWEDLASVDYDVLAIPKHRIQYFKYKDIIVWDKRSRLDKVFGSTGDGERIFDIESVRRDNGEVTQSNKLTISDIDHERIYDATMSENVNRPNYFLCFKINDDSIKAKVKKAQESILSYDDRLESTCLSLDVLHVTLLMFRLDDNHDKEKAVAVAHQLNTILVSMIPSYKALKLSGVGCFNDKVIYIKVELEPVLMKFGSIAMMKFEEAGIKMVGNHVPFTPHLTIMKLTRPICRRFKIDGYNRFSWKEIQYNTFGNVNINGLYVCSTGKQRGSDGFYCQLIHARNLLSVIMPRIQEMILPRIVEYVKMSSITESEGDTLIDSLVNGSDINVEEALVHLQNILELSAAVTDFTDKRVFIMRGLPGVGKTHYIRENIGNQNDDITICSADMFFDGVRQFDTSLLVDAHTFCRSQFLDAMAMGVNTVVVDNTNSQQWEYSLYKRLATLFGYQYQIIELSLDDDNSSISLLTQRCQHDVSVERLHGMQSRWQNDPMAKIIHVTLDEKSTPQPNFIAMEIPDSVTNTMLEQCRAAVLYSAVFLDMQSKQKLIGCFPANHKRVTADHMTMQMTPLAQTMRHIPIGQNIKMKVIGYLCNDIIQAVAVSEIGQRITTSNQPHVTISTSSKTLPRCVNDALASQVTSDCEIPLDYNGQPIFLSGTVGLKVATDGKNSTAIINQKDFINFISSCNASMQSLQISSKNLKMIDDQDEDLNPVSIDDGQHMITELHVFDFDGTLFNTPDPVEGRKQYALISGHPWPFKSFLSQPKSLLYPLHVHPGPAFTDFVSHCHSVNSVTVVMTGRMERMRQAVDSVLSDFGLTPHRSILKPEDRNENAPSSYKGKVSSYKRASVADLMTEFPDVKLVKFWDDRTDNCKSIKELASQRPNVKFEIFQVGDHSKMTYKSNDKLRTATQFQDSQLLQILNKFNIIMDVSRQRLYDSVLKFLGNCWSNVLNTNASHCLLPFGSFKLGFDGDLDICMLASKRLTVAQCMSKLSTELRQHNITYIYTAPHTRCPRMKVKLFYAHQRPVEVDLTFACCLSEAEIAATEMDLQMKIVQCFETTKSQIEKTVLAGPVFWDKLLKTLRRNNYDSSMFSLVAAASVLFMKTQRLKGNAFACMRTFHVAAALKNIIKKDENMKQTLDESFVYLFNCLANMSFDEWKVICLDFVPDTEIIKAIGALSVGSITLDTCPFDTLFQFTEFPKPNHCIVRVKLVGNTPLKQWLGTSLLHAKLTATCRQLLNANVSMTAGPILSDGSYSFSFENSKSLELTTRIYMNKLCREFEENECTVTYAIDKFY